MRSNHSCQLFGVRRVSPPNGRHAQTSSEMKTSFPLLPASERYDLLLDNQTRDYVRHIIDALRTHGTLELADGNLTLWIVRRDIKVFRRNRRLDPERFAERMLVDRIRYHSEKSFILECSAMNHEPHRDTASDTVRSGRLTDLQHICVVRADRYMSAPWVDIRSLYLLTKLVERSLRLSSGTAEPADHQPFDTVSQNDRGDERDLERVSERFSTSISALKRIGNLP